MKKPQQNIETLNKYMAGLFDADGYVNIHFCNSYPGIRMGITLSTNDPKSEELIRTLHNHYGVGKVYKRPNCTIQWIIYSYKEVLTFSNCILKHSLIKAKHIKYCISLYEEIKGKPYKNTKEITKKVKKSRKDNSGPLKPKNFVSDSWLAGFTDGDGCFRIQERKRTINGRDYYGTDMNYIISLADYDSHALELIQKTWGGIVRKSRPGKTCEYLMEYYLGLGFGKSSTAIKFARALVKHLHLKKKKAEDLLCRHLQRLNEKTSKEEVIV